MTRSEFLFFLRRAGWRILMLGIVSSVLFAGDFPPKKYAVQLVATTAESPPAISFTWPGDPDTENYQVSKRTPDSLWQPLTILDGSAVAFTDANVEIGKVYEYQFIKQWGGTNHGYGYIRSGIKAPLVDSHGKIILIVEASLAASASSELGLLQQDLIGDGWQVVQQTVSANDAPPSVRQLIQTAYNAAPTNLKAVFLLGHVPVPYSGNINPDGHPNHQGAWPADVYYGDVDGAWTDSTLTTTNAERQANWNVPGDGKFDQDEPPSTVELAVGRVDLSNMTSFANKTPARSELDLMRQYFAKDHAFRHRLFTVQRRGLICDNFSDKGKDPISGSAWRSFPTFFGHDETDEAPWDGYFPAASTNSYLWSFASGGGSYYYATGVGTSDDFALQNVQAVFTMWMGSYFGDWNNESNFLRAPLGSGDVLTSSYSGFPSTWYFPMGLGETIGYCILQSQNNNTNGLFAPWDQGSHQVHISLMGDPTLRMLPVIPPSDLTASVKTGRVDLAWGVSSDVNVVGYHLYRASSVVGPFARFTDSPITGTTYSDSPVAGAYTYAVRAVKLEQTASGSFYNPSQAIFANAAVAGAGAGPIKLEISRSGQSQLLIQLEGQGGQSYTFQSSFDLHKWTTLNTGTFSGPTVDLSAVVSGRLKGAYYRAFTTP